MSRDNNEMETPVSRSRASSVFYGSLQWLISAVVILALTGCNSTDKGFFQPVANQPVSSIRLPDPGNDTNAASASPQNFMVREAGRQAATAGQPGVSPANLEAGGGFYSTNELHAGDAVSIMFQYSTNFNTDQRISLDGTLNLAMVGTVKAAGKTVTQLQQDLTRIYEPLAKGDVITVKLVSSIACVYVDGAVIRPGAVEINRPLTVLEAVMEAGGFDSTRAKLSAVTVLRIEKGRQKTYRINLNKVLDGKDDMPFYLQPFDIIYVPAKVFNY